MSANTPDSPVLLRRVNAASSLGVAVGIIIQIATGVDSYPTVPPGAVLAVVVALAVAFVSWRYITVLGLVFPVWIVIGALTTSGTGDRLGDPGTVGPFLGTVVQVVALAVGLVTGLALVARLIRSPRASRASA